MTRVDKNMEKLEPCTVLGGINMVHPLRKTLWWFIKKVKTEQYMIRIPLLSICPRKTEIQVSKK
jgi:hypothetical protein